MAGRPRKQIAAPAQAGTQSNSKRITYTINPKQELFFAAKQRYVAYGGARAGGKSWSVQHKALQLCLEHPGIQIVIIRRRYTDLEENHIRPMRQEFCVNGLAEYYGNTHSMMFANGSRILFKHLNNINDQDEYQGLQFDVIFMDEATQFTETEFRMLGACLRGVNSFPKRFYLTCNPGGIGHQWVKRLFITKQYEAKSHENPKDYFFIPATVEDNAAMGKDQIAAYIQMLDLLPESIRRAHRYGDWDALAGQFFASFRPETHVIKPFNRIPAEWSKYRAFDYGLDMFACLWIAVDFDGRAYVYRELNQKNLVVSDAAAQALDMTPDYEQITYTIAPPDMWTTSKDTGRTLAELFTQNGIALVKGNNSRVSGWATVSEYLKLAHDGKPMLYITEDCRSLIENLPALQHDLKNPSDVAKEPHEITHNCLSGDTVIRTVGGDKPIRDLIGTFGKVYCWDGAEIMQGDYGYVTKTRENAEVYEVLLDDGTRFKATADHRVLTASGWKTVGQLTGEDEVLNFKM